MEININFAIDLFQAAEKEARETERFILVAIGAIYAPWVLANNVHLKLRLPSGVIVCC